MSPRRVHHRLLGALASWAVLATVVRVVVALPEHCPAVSADTLMDGAVAAVEWLDRNQLDDGRWLYRYDANDDEVVDDYNTVRHAGVVMSLYQAASFDIDGALELADAGTGYALDHLVRHDDWAAFEPSADRVTTGASALLVAGLAERRMHTGEDRYDDAMRDLSRFLVAHVEPSGAVIESWDRRRREPRHGLRSPFFTGEVYWALASMHLLFPDEGWDEPALRIGHYIATERDEAEGWWPELPDHWAAYGMSVVTRWPDRPDPGRPVPDAQVPYVERQAGLGSIQTRYESQRVDTWPRYLLRGRRTLGAGLGTVGEQLVGLWQVATSDDRLEHLADPIAERARCVAGMLADRQVSPDEAQEYPRPDLARGAWFQFGFTQMDDQQHALSALLLTLSIIDAEETRP
ncbi:MAG: hypothetical protein ACLFRV_13060 [Acidimicrobiales bacterium]